MEDWQSSPENQPRRRRKEKPKPSRPKKNQPQSDSWQPAVGGQAAQPAGRKRSREYWSDQEKSPTNWNRIRHWSKLAVLGLVAALLVGTLVWIWLNWGRKTDLVLLKPDTGRPGWMTGTPFLESVTAESLSANQSHLQVAEGYQLVDLESDDWQRLQDDAGIQFGGPDGNVLMYYLNATGVATPADAPEVPDEENEQLTPWLLDANAFAFNWASPVKLVSLESLLDRVLAVREDAASTTVVFLDIQQLSSPVHPGLLHDRFSAAVQQLWTRKYAPASGNQNLVLVLSHSTGERNWPAPELRGSVFGFFTRLALLGAANGSTGQNPDGMVSLGEFVRYVSFHVADYVREKRLAVQRPMILAADDPQLLELPLVYCNSPSSVEAALPAISGKDAAAAIGQLCNKAGLARKWQQFAALNAAGQLNQQPVRAARATSILVRLEQLAMEFAWDSPEIPALEKEFDQIVEYLERESLFAPVSLAEAAWLDRQPRVASPATTGRYLPNDVARNELQTVLTSWTERPTTPPDAAPPAGENAEGDQAPPDEAKNTDEAKSGDSASTSTDTPAAAAAPADDLEKLGKRVDEIRTQPWTAAVLLHDGVVGNDRFPVTAETLGEWLDVLDNPQWKLPGGLPFNDLVEIRFLRLLHENIDWAGAAAGEIGPVVRLAVRCRDRCERFAVEADPQVRFWVSPEFVELESRRRIAEDHLFAGDYAFAGKELQAVINALEGPDGLVARAEALSRAFALRNDIARKSPHLAMLIARQVRREELTGQRSPSGVDFAALREDWENLTRQNHELNYELWYPTTRLEETATREFFQENIASIVALASSVRERLDKLEGQLGRHCDYLADIKTNDIQSLVYISDLLFCPLVLNRREELRQRWLDSLSVIEETVRAGRAVEELPSDTGPRPEVSAFEVFMQNAAQAIQQEWFTPDQRLAAARLYRTDLHSIHLPAESLTAISAQLDAELAGQTELPRQRSVLLNADYWVRTVAAELGDYAGLFSERPGAEPLGFEFLTHTGVRLAETDRSLHTREMIERTVNDFWGNNQLGDSSQPWFQRVAAVYYGRLPDAHRRILDAQLQPLLASRIASAREFQIICEDFRYLVDQAEMHSFSVHADLNSLPESGDSLRFRDGRPGPLLVTQMQGWSRGLNPEPVPINLVGESGTTEMRRVPLGLDQLQGGDTSRRSFYFLPQTLETTADLQAVLAFRGHLASSSFLIRGEQITPDYVRTVAVDYTPAALRPPVVTVLSAEEVTDVVFVLDCSYSMKGQYRGGGDFEGEASAAAAQSTGDDSANQPKTRFQFLGNAMIDVLREMRTAGLHRVGLVAIGSRVNFQRVERNGRTVTLDELRYSDPAQAEAWQRAGFRPGDDAAEIHRITPVANWPEREQQALEDALLELQPFGQTPLYAGMLRAAEMLAASGDARRKVIVVISDGVEETYELSAAGIDLDSGKSQSSYDRLKTLLPAAGIDVCFVGFDVNNDNSELTRQQKQRLGQEFDNRLRQMQDLASKVFFPDQYQAFKENLEEIARGSSFEIRQDGNLVSAEELNRSWTPDAGTWNPGFHDIAIAGKSASARVWLEGGENVTMRFNGEVLEMDARQPSVSSRATVSAPRTVMMGSSEYNVAFFQPNLERPDVVPLEFGLQRLPTTEFSARPSRLCLEILPEAGTSTDYRYILQDCQISGEAGRNYPVARFLAPRLSVGNSTYRLWYRPFESSPPRPAGLIAIAPANLAGPASSLQQTISVAGEDIHIRAWGNDQDRSITVQVSAGSPDRLRRLLVDLWSEGQENGAVPLRLNIPAHREFAETVLLSGSEPAEKEGVFSKHTFYVEDRFRTGQLAFTVTALEEVFTADNRIEFSYRND